MFKACCIGDEGRPFEFCFQEWGSNHLRAASVKSWGGERLRKRHLKKMSDMFKEDERK